ncbi:MAG: hypothetical protein CM1200mP2_01120 [Planctomycetaceae bacterium]|nr:MAG: hypothetical protein CM1200mP2_01120 [Planctomycetaceae bacterium]
MTDPEPLPRDHPLLDVENVIIMPHLGSASNRAREMMMNMSIENLEAGLADEELPYRIRPRVPTPMQIWPYLPRLDADAPSIKAVIKRDPEDFVVEEVAAYEPFRTG